MKKSRNPKFLLPGRPALPFGPIIFGQGLKFKIPLPTNSSFCHPDSKKVWHYPPNPKSTEEIDLAETAVFRPRANTDQRAVPNYLPKNYLRGVWVSLKFWWRFIAWVKSYGTFLLGRTDTQTHRRTDTQTHRHTFLNRPCTTRGVKKIFCIYVWGKLCTTTNPAKFLPFHSVKDNYN